MSKRFAFLSLWLLAAACDSPPPTAPDLKPLADLKAAATVVHAGQSIQAAIDAATAGSVIQIEPGIYAEALTIDKPGLRLVGLGGDGKPGVVIKNPGGVDNGITVRRNSAGIVLENFTVRDFLENGVILIGVDGFRFSRITAIKKGEYGLFPVVSSHGVIERCTATGHSDAGIYVGQSTDVEVRQSIAHDNVLGIEIENSTRVGVFDNESYHNVVGVMVVLLPGLAVKTSEGVRVLRNRVHDNNVPNFGHPGELESFVPTGSGILVVGVDRAIIDDNVVTGNQFVGVGLGSTLLLGALAGLPPEAFADIEPNPDGVRITNNNVTGNGGTSSIPFLPAVDLLWDGSGTNNCWFANQSGTSVPNPLPACPRGRS
ncbi:MAG: parallel beta-helix domain-containing protein [Gemmatimonadota bacterium]